MTGWVEHVSLKESGREEGLEPMVPHKDNATNMPQLVVWITAGCVGLVLGF